MRTRRQLATTEDTEEILWIDSCHPINSESRRSFSRNQRLCSSVSGTRTPRALETRSMAGSSVIPSATTSDTARSPDLPTLCRQCAAMFDPSRTSRARRSTVATNASVSCGTPRSGTGSEMNSMSCFEQIAASSSSATLSVVTLLISKACQSRKHEEHEDLSCTRDLRELRAFVVYRRSDQRVALKSTPGAATA